MTENMVFIAPQIAMKRPAAAIEKPSSKSPTVAPPMISAGNFRREATLPLMNRPAAHVPMKPAQPRSSRSIESMVTSTPVTCSRNGRR
ncbi:hypothetical protein D3C80_1649180 [compost metagenome]